MYRYITALLVALSGGIAPAQGPASSSQPSVVLELFTSGGCSSCPPAYALLRTINLKTTSSGTLVVELSEHVTYDRSDVLRGENAGSVLEHVTLVRSIEQIGKTKGITPQQLPVHVPSSS